MTKANFIQVGKNWIKCGHCDDRFTPADDCKCICHTKDGMTLIEKTLKLFKETFACLLYDDVVIEIEAFITQALQEQDRESRKTGMKEVLLKVKGNLERYKDKPSLGYTFDVKDNLNSIEDYAKQHNIDLKQDEN